MKANEERWLPYPSAPKYQVSDQGRIRRWLKTKKQWKMLSLGKDVYPTLFTVVDGKKAKFYVHRMVMEAFVGPAPDGCQVNHKDSNKWNNHLDNLEYVTPAENNRHCFTEGNGRSGDTHHFTKLKDEEVYSLVEMHASGYSVKELAVLFGVSTVTIYGYVKKPYKRVCLRGNRI